MFDDLELVSLDDMHLYMSGLYSLDDWWWV